MDQHISRSPAKRDDEPSRLRRMKLPDRVAGAQSVRDADLALIARAPNGFLDTTHFDTVRFPPPPWSEEVFVAALRDGTAAYSPYRGHPHVLRTVARNVSDLLGLSVSPEHNLILTPGTQAGLMSAISALAERGSKVALASPEYLFDERMLRFLDVETIPVPLDIQAGAPDLAALEAAFRDGARLFVFSHPSNPTGLVYPAHVIAEIARLAVAYDARVMVDELYCRLLYDDTPFCHLAAQPGMAERTVTLLGPSKTESLSGFRLGVVVAPVEIVARLENVLSILALRAPAYGQSQLEHWLADDRDWLAERMRDFTALRDLTAAKLRQLPWLEMIMGKGTAYAWPDVSALGMPSLDVAQRLLVDAGVLVSPGYQFGPDQEGRFRVCYARDEDTWSAALDRMVNVLSRLGSEAGL